MARVRWAEGRLNRSRQSRAGGREADGPAAGAAAFDAWSLVRAVAQWRLGLVDVADKDRGEAVLALLAAARRLVRLRHAGLDPGPARLRAAARGKRPRCRREPRRWLR